MSKFDEKVALYEASAKELGLKIPGDLLRKVTKGLGPSIYLPDASLVSGADAEEVARVKNNFLIKKLGLKDSAELDAAITEALTQMGTSNKNKYRALVYSLLVIKFKKESIYA